MSEMTYEEFITTRNRIAALAKGIVEECRTLNAKREGLTIHIDAIKKMATERDELREKLRGMFTTPPEIDEMNSAINTAHYWR